jgi:hypothetical protein
VAVVGRQAGEAMESREAIEVESSSRQAIVVLDAAEDG